MRTLKESLLGDLDAKVSMSEYDIAVPEIEEFIRNNYSMSLKYTISKKPNKDGLFVLNSRSDVKVLNRSATSLTNGMFTWGKCKSFNCSTTKITNLKGAPEKTGVFECTSCHKLESLEGCPKEVSHIILRDSGIKNLIGLPESYEGDLILDNCTSLESLEGCPKHLCSLHLNGCTKLKSLKYSPEVVEETVDCIGCISLKSLEGAPKQVGGNFVCRGCVSLKTFAGAPKYIGISFNALNCTNVESLDVPYMTVGRNFCIDGALKLKSFEGIPNKIGDSFTSKGCTNVHSFVGLPEKFKGLYVDGKEFNSLEGFPKKLMYLDMGYDNTITVSDILKVCDITIQNIELH